MKYKTAILFYKFHQIELTRADAYTAMEVVMSRRPREQVDYLHLEELGGLEMLKASYFQQEFSRHAHEGFCIGVIEEGAQRFYRTGGESCCAARRYYFGEC